MPNAETGLDYFGARYFSAAQGRFTSPDPLMASARASNPQTWNRYAYTLNNPLRYVDPDGMDVPAECAKDPNCTIKVKEGTSMISSCQGKTHSSLRSRWWNFFRAARSPVDVPSFRLDHRRMPAWPDIHLQHPGPSRPFAEV
ncbi:RHS repeat-associated core domain-containing protein [Paludibaculum fermentans]|uniref:RHS repeat-associated core domain-containing protein n=1 Tax=Paludibaculum fermentans TaxID=1473598 RepID=UPI003EB92B13